MPMSNDAEKDEGGFRDWNETTEVIEKPVPKKLSEHQLKKVVGEKQGRMPIVCEKFQVIVMRAPEKSNVERGDSDTFSAPDESHARRMFIQKYDLDPQGNGAAAAYTFQVIPQFKDLRPHAPYNTESAIKTLNAYQEKRGKQPTVAVN